MTCEQCNGECRHRTVTLDLGAIGGVHHFCCDRCEHHWMKSQLEHKNTYLNKIRIRARGFARDIARIALHSAPERNPNT